jgi:hypothetical protein
MSSMSCSPGTQVLALGGFVSVVSPRSNMTDEEAAAAVVLEVAQLDWVARGPCQRKIKAFRSLSSSFKPFVTRGLGESVRAAHKPRCKCNGWEPFATRRVVGNRIILLLVRGETTEEPNLITVRKPFEVGDKLILFTTMLRERDDPVDLPRCWA